MNRTFKASLAALLALSVGAFAFTGCVVVDDDYVCDDGEILFEAGDVSCDGYVDCYDGSDEYYCAADYVCDNGDILAGYGDVSCDGVYHCYDNSDELGCGGCLSDEVPCLIGGYEDCGVLCDAVFECDDDFDEAAAACL